MPSSDFDNLVQQAVAHIEDGEYQQAHFELDELLSLLHADTDTDPALALRFYNLAMDVASLAYLSRHGGAAILATNFRNLPLRILSRSNQLVVTHIKYQLAILIDDPVRKRNYFEDVLAFDRTHMGARRALAILDGKLKPEEIVDADHLPAQSSETQKVSPECFNCPKCGSHMVFAPDGSKLVCESCARQETISATSPDNEQNFIANMATGQGQRAPVATKTFTCQGCGAQFLLPPEVISQNCCYCGSVYVLAGASDLVEPDSIIPMAFNQHEAARRLVAWVEKHKIEPEGKVQAPRGLYVPIWTFDVSGMLTWWGDLVEFMGEYAYTDYGREFIDDNDLIVMATSKLADLLPEITTDFSTESAPAYDPRYLAGWPAEIYQITLADASLNIRKEAVAHLKGRTRQSDHLRYSTANLSILSFKLVLVPIWMTEYVHEGCTYRVIINGQTGLVYGETASRGILGWLEDALGG